MLRISAARSKVRGEILALACKDLPRQMETLPRLFGSSTLFTRRARTSTGRPFSTEAKDRPFKVLGLQQVAIGALEKKALTRLWTDMLGVEKIASFKSEAENVDEDILRLGVGWSAVEVDLMQPLDAQKAPKVHVPALNHIGIWVDPLPACVEWLSERGMRFTPGGIRKGAGGHLVAFIHPKGNADKPLSGEGILIELVQAPPEVVAAVGKQAT